LQLREQRIEELTASLANLKAPKAPTVSRGLLKIDQNAKHPSILIDNL